MTFTKTPPTVPGAYWLNEFGHGRPGAPMLVTVAVGSMAVRHGGLMIALKPSDVDGEWCGPLVPVEEVEAAWQECDDRNDRFGFARWDGSRARRVVEGEQV